MKQKDKDSIKTASTVLELGVPKYLTLACPCGEPLQLGRMPDGRWVLGHLDKMCSPLIYHKDLSKVMEKFVELQDVLEGLKRRERSDEAT